MICETRSSCSDNPDIDLNTFVTETEIFNRKTTELLHGDSSPGGAQTVCTLMHLKSRSGIRGLVLDIVY